jgi:hypothetical protein
MAQQKNANVRVIKKLVRAAKNAMKQLEFSPPCTDGVTWRRGAAWDELYNAVRVAERATTVRRK